MKVTVIVVNWNGERFLERCLAALMEQTIKPHEVIVLDNASTDDSLAIVRRFPSVHLMSLDYNSGFARGNNIAIRDSSPESEWVILLNPDAFPEPQWLENLLIASRENPEFDVFASKMVEANNSELLDGSGDVYHISGLVWRRGCNRPVSSVPDNVDEIFSPCAAAAMYKRKVLLESGGFDEDFFCYLEDVDLGFRLRLAGYRCLYAPTSVVYHVGSGTTGGQHSDFAVYHGHRNLVWTYVKDMPGLLFWMFLSLHLAMNVFAVVVFTVRGQGRVILRAKRDALKGIPKMWRKRKDIQSRRKARLLDLLRVMTIRFW